MVFQIYTNMYNDNERMYEEEPRRSTRKRNVDRSEKGRRDKLSIRFFKRTRRLVSTNSFDQQRRSYLFCLHTALVPLWTHCPLTSFVTSISVTVALIYLFTMTHSFNLKMLCYDFNAGMTSLQFLSGFTIVTLKLSVFFWRKMT